MLLLSCSGQVSAHACCLQGYHIQRQCGLAVSSHASLSQHVTTSVDSVTALIIPEQSFAQFDRRTYFLV